MGADYISSAVIGCQVPIEKLWKQSLKRSCEHQNNDDAVFCSTCGKKIENVTENDSIFSDDAGYDIKAYNAELPNGLSIACSTDGRHAVAGYECCAGDDEPHFTTIREIPDLKTIIKDTLDPLGLWDEKKFGLYSILYCSY